ncbi:hypothetical protein PRIPAC_72532, partial [Pristionchus pacificus]|uniref:Uncharacterized protein n=1 Tax=Pristionchus pacificus TaxID=54126 RepID=A0A2A6CA55_PRIPA
MLWCASSTWIQVIMGFQLGSKYSTPASGTQLGSKQESNLDPSSSCPVASITHQAYKATVTLFQVGYKQISKLDPSKNPSCPQAWSQLGNLLGSNLDSHTR